MILVVGKIRLTLVLAAAAMLIAACGQGKGTSEPEASRNAVEMPAASVDTDSGSESVTIKYYVSDADMTGLKEVSAAVKPAEDGGIYRSALEALQITNEERDEYSLWKGIEIREVTLEDGRLTVNISIPDEARLGAPGESLALEAITKTAFQFEEVRALDILIDGEAADSLMGHEFLEHPILRSSALTS